MAPALALLTTLVAAVLPDDPPRPAILPGEHELPLVHGGFAAPTAWLALWRGDAWVCWDLADHPCWQRLDLAGQVDLRDRKSVV